MMMNRKYIIVGGLALVVNLGLVIYLYLGNNTKTTNKLEKVKILEQENVAEKTLIPKKQLAMFSLETERTTVSKGSLIEIRVILDTPKPLLGADAVILYDPAELKLEKLQAGNMFPDYPRTLNQEDKGRIVITGVNINEEELVSNRFALIQFRAIGSSGAVVSFVDGEKGSTAIRGSDGENILTHTKEIKILIQ